MLDQERVSGLDRLASHSGDSGTTRAVAVSRRVRAAANATSSDCQESCREAHATCIAVRMKYPPAWL